MKIKHVKANNNAKCITIRMENGSDLSLPFSVLRLKPTVENKITDLFIDPEAGNEAITYHLQSGEEDTIPADDFLYFNSDPDYLKRLALYDASIAATKARTKLQLSIRHISKRLNTSASQLYRLFDTTNYNKSLDQMFRLLTVLQCEPQLRVNEPNGVGGVEQLARKFQYLNEEQIKGSASTPFRGLLAA